MSDIVTPKVPVTTRILVLPALRRSDLKELAQLQGKRSVTYLRFRYGSPKTYVLMAYVNDQLAHAEWIVPYRKIKSRYHFVGNDSYSIIACLTSKEHRGQGIYPSQLQKVMQAEIPTEIFWIWSASSNFASLRGIRKAGGKKVGYLIQDKWLWGAISRVRYTPQPESDCPQQLDGERKS